MDNRSSSELLKYIKWNTSLSLTKAHKRDGEMSIRVKITIKGDHS